LLAVAVLVLVCLLGAIGSIVFAGRRTKTADTETVTAATDHSPPRPPTRVAPERPTANSLFPSPAPSAKPRENNTSKVVIAPRVRPPKVKTAPPAEDLSEQLLRVPEISLSGVDELRGRQIAYAKSRGAGARVDRTRNATWEAGITNSLGRVLHEAADAGLPVRLGRDCTLSPQAAEALGRGAVDIRSQARATTLSGGETYMTAPVNRNTEGSISVLDRRTSKVASTFTALPRFALRPANDLRKLFEVTWPAEKVEQRFDVVPVLTQVLQVEDEPYRRLLVEELDRLPGPEAGAALARRALYDPAPDVRWEAAEALKRRPAGEYRNVLIDGFRYPWAPVARHAAEALVRTGDVQALPRLAKLLDAPNPALPFRNERTHKQEIREVVRINHLRNCCLCHAPSFNNDDWVPGRVMEPGVAIPAEYYGTPTGAFVRADITYLRQDFSTMEPVDDPRPWPRMQRFDYLVRTRTPTAEELARAAGRPADASYPQRDSVLLALRGLSGRDLGRATEPWQQYAEGIEMRSPK
jgi:hypothetical protein